MNITCFPAGPLETNGYLVIDNNEAVIIDPSLGSTALITKLKESGAELQAILLTHSHFDHYLGIYEIFEEFGNVPLWLHDDERFIIADPEKSGANWINWGEGFEGETVHYTEGTNQVGSFTFEAVFCPGHTPGGVSLRFGNDCFTGDTLFKHSVGRSDFGYSSTEDLMNSISEKLFSLPEETVIWPGHGGNSTIGNEIKHNPYVR